jgi:hypothetical protein
MASESISRRTYGHDNNEPSGAIVEEINRDHDSRPRESWLMPNGLAQVDVIDLASPDHTKRSHS